MSMRAVNGAALRRCVCFGSIPLEVGDGWSEGLRSSHHPPFVFSREETEIVILRQLRKSLGIWNQASATEAKPKALT